MEMVNLGAVSLKRLGCYGGGIFFLKYIDGKVILYM